MEALIERDRTPPAGWATDRGWGRKGRQVLGGGVMAGLAGALAFSVFTFFVDWLRGHSIWVGFKAAAYPLLRDRVMAPGFDLQAVGIGLAFHLALCALLGLLFAVAAHGMSRSATVGLGAVFGFVVWLGLSFVVLPLASASLITRGTPTLMVLAQHLAFGLAVGAGFLPYQQQISRWGPVWSQPMPSMGAATYLESVRRAA